MNYSYEPLNSRRQIRLLEIRGSSGSEPHLEATLQVANLDSDPDQQQLPYYALSWCWGVPGRTKPLILNNTVVQIRENLYSALVSLIKHIDGVLIWVDALCINQSDDAEKNVQVAMMAEIYHNAIGVVAWIGESNADSDLIFNPSEFQPTATDPPITAQDRRLCFQTILSRPYWKRLWTVQERRFAREIWILCGDHIAQWDKLRQEFAEYRASGIQQNEFGFNPEIEKKSLLELMKENRELQCKDKRDKAYAVRSLATEGDHLLIDYSKPLLQVFFDIFLVLDLSTVPQALTTGNLMSWYGDPNLWRLLKVARRLQTYFPLTETDISPILSSETFMNDDRRHDITIPQPGEENQLNTWLVGSYASMTGPRKAASYGGQFFVIPHAIRTGSCFGPEDLFGRRAEGLLNYRCAPSIKYSDIRLHLGNESSLLGGVLPIIRRNASGGGDFVCLARGIGIFSDENKTDMRPITLRTLELLWDKKHIRVCTVTPKLNIIRFHLAGTRTCLVGVHFSKLALLTHFAIDSLPMGRGSPGADLPLYYQEAAERAQEISSPLSCGCRDSFTELYG